jgi:hypothetical protein
MRVRAKRKLDQTSRRKPRTNPAEFVVAGFSRKTGKCPAAISLPKLRRGRAIAPFLFPVDVSGCLLLSSHSAFWNFAFREYRVCFRMTPDEARQLIIDCMDYAAYHETDSSLHDSDKNRLFGSEYYKSDRPIYNPSPWDEGDFEEKMTTLLVWANVLNRSLPSFADAQRLLEDEDSIIGRLIQRARKQINKKALQPDDIKLVVVQSFGSQFEAELAKGVLEEADIPAIIQGDTAGRMREHLAWSGAGFKLLVREDDAAKARDVLASPMETGENPDADSQTDDDSFPPWRRFS